MKRHAPQRPHHESLMTWAQHDQVREHVAAALGVVIGCLGTILLLIAVAVIR